jgi:hypothetical protein
VERRVRGNSHARCDAGENPKIISKDYLSQSGAKSQGIKQLMAGGGVALIGMELLTAFQAISYSSAKPYKHSFLDNLLLHITSLCVPYFHKIA